MTEDRMSKAVESGLFHQDPPAEAEADAVRRSRIADLFRKTPSKKKAADMEFRPLGDFQQRNPRWLWPDRIARGELNLIAGDPETMKTTIAIDIAARCTVGGKWPLEDYQAPKCAVMWIGTSENSPEYVLLPRFRAAGGDASKLFVHWHTIDGHGEKRPFAISSDVEVLGKKIKDARAAGHDVRLVIIDPAPEFLGAGIDSWKDDQVRALLGPLIQMAKDEDFAIIGIIHPRKATDADRVLSNIAGSGAWGWLSRSIAFTRRLRDEDGNDTDEIVLMWEKASLPPRHPSSLKYKSKGVPVQPEKDGDETITSAGVVDWLEACDIRLRELLSPTGRKMTEKDKAIEWLQDRLADGPVEAEVIAKEADVRGFKPGVLKRARDDLGIASTPSGFGGKRMLKLPPDPFAPIEIKVRPPKAKRHESDDGPPAHVTDIPLPDEP